MVGKSVVFILVQQTRLITLSKIKILHVIKIQKNRNVTS